MGKFRTEDIRNIALVGHRAAGKTTLADALLFKAGAVDRRGSVDDGTSISDFDEDEHARKVSIDTTVLHADVLGKHVNLLDAPGSPDFVGELRAGLRAADAALFVVSAVNGVDATTVQRWEEGRWELTPDAEMLAALSRVLQVSTSEVQAVLSDARRRRTSSA